MKIYLVGGAVRDKLLGLPVKEKDYVVTGATVQDMLDKGFQQVGKEFPVFLHPQTREEYALARMERKVGPGYKGFTFDTSPKVSLEEDLLRRDLTINAMALDLETNTLVDPYGGQQDLQSRTLRHVSSAFSEDPVRILRIGRFLARFASLGFDIAPETMDLMRAMVTAGEVDALVAERVWKELERALGESRPDQFFEVLSLCGALPILFPHLKPQGHGIQALRASQPLSTEASVRFAALLHDMPEDQEDKSTARQTIAALCRRYRVPNACHELAKLVATHASTAFQERTLSPDTLLQLFSSLDIFRREERFQDFLLACMAIANSRHKSFDAEWLLSCARIAKSCDVQELLREGLEGERLAHALKHKRREAIENWLKQS